MHLDRHGGGDRQPQPSAPGEQGDRPDLLGRIGDWSGEPQPQLGLAPGNRQSQPPASQQEGAMVEADRHQGSPAPREPGGSTVAATLGRLEPGVAVPPRHGPSTGHRQLSEGADNSELAAQRLVLGDRRQPLAETLVVGVQQPGPDVPSRAQQPIAAVGLPSGGTDTDPSRSMHEAAFGSHDSHIERMFGRRRRDVKPRRAECG